MTKELSDVIHDVENPLGNTLLSNKEKASGVKEDRPELRQLLDYVREGDTFVICKLDRIARSTTHLLTLVEELEQKGVAFQVLNINLDTSTATGKFMPTMLGAITTFERKMKLERQREGIRHAKERGLRVGKSLPEQRVLK